MSLTAEDLTTPLQSDAGWLRVSDGGISVYTQTEAAGANSLLRMFSQLRQALAQTGIYRVNETATLKVIDFHSERQFDQYRLNSSSCAFFQQTRRSEYVVLQDLAPDYRDISAHEFTHFVMAHAGLTLPLWLNEGMADFYSTFQVSADRVTFGRSVPGRLPVLRGRALVPIENLFQITTSSPYYSDPQRMVLFYSESWALAHMLLVSPAYADRFPDFLRALNEGHSSVDSARIAYNKTPIQIQQDLRDYLDQQHLPVIEVHLKSPSISPSFSSTPVSNAEMDLTLGDLTPNNLKTESALESRLITVSSQSPKNAAAEESLGYLALRQNKIAEVLTHFQLAADRHSSDPNVFFYLAHFRHEAGAPSSQVMPLLEQALALQPDLGDARLELALIATSDGNFEQAIAALKKLGAPRPENAYAAAYTEAYCYAHLEKLTEARVAAQRAQSIAVNDRDRAEVSELLQFIAQ